MKFAPLTVSSPPSSRDSAIPTSPTVLLICTPPMDRDFGYLMSMDEDSTRASTTHEDDIHMICPRWSCFILGVLLINKGRTTINQVCKAMNSIYFALLSTFPKYLKSGSGHHYPYNDCNSSKASPLKQRHLHCRHHGHL